MCIRENHKTEQRWYGGMLEELVGQLYLVGLLRACMGALTYGNQALWVNSILYILIYLSGWVYHLTWSNDWIERLWPLVKRLTFVVLSVRHHNTFKENQKCFAFLFYNMRKIKESIVMCHVFWMENGLLQKKYDVTNHLHNIDIKSCEA